MKLVPTKKRGGGSSRAKKSKATNSILPVHKTLRHQAEALTRSMSSRQKKLVPTKKHDGGSTKAEKTKPDHFDAFLYYSNESNRMNTLLGNQDCTRSLNNEDGSMTVFRQTRISFELDPTLIMMEELLRMGDDEQRPLG